jgi:hypothetical protein
MVRRSKLAGNYLTIVANYFTRGVGHRGAGKITPGKVCVSMPLPKSRVFFEYATFSPQSQ